MISMSPRPVDGCCSRQECGNNQLFSGPQPAATRRALAPSLTPHSEELWLHCRGLGGSEEEAISGHCNCHK